MQPGVKPALRFFLWDTPGGRWFFAKGRIYSVESRKKITGITRPLWWALVQIQDSAL